MHHYGKKALAALAVSIVVWAYLPSGLVVKGVTMLFLGGTVGYYLALWDDEV